jgi:GT2 family glycosyltransferase
VSAFERFDLNGRAATPREIVKRWHAFHRQVRMVSSTPFARVVGPLLGDDTLRRRFVERWRPAAAEAVPVAPSQVNTFPPNYVASTPTPPMTPSEVLEHVEFVIVRTSEPSELIENFHQALASTKEWLLIVAEGTGEYARVAAAATLFVHRGEADVVFGDEAGDSSAIPLLKPREVGPHTLLSYNVVGRPALLRRETVAREGGLRVEAGRAAEHDLYLRLFDAQATFRHVPVVLAGRTSQERHHVDLALDTQRVVAEALLRRSITARVTTTARPSVVTWSPIPDAWPSIDIVIPTRDRVDLLRKCIASVEASSYPNYAITILDNSSTDPATLEYLATTTHRVIDCAGPFNYAAIINRGVAQCSADFVLTLNNDAIVRTCDWLEQMVGVASLDDVSIVGVTLLDQHDVHEHDAIVIAPYPQHLRRGINYLVDDESVLARRDVSAVTGAVQLISRTRYLELAGMDEKLTVVMNDVDLCLRSQATGQHVVMLPDVVVSHFAGSTRGRLDPLTDRNYFVRRWDVFGTLVDPYFPETLRLFGHTMQYHAVVPDWARGQPTR